LLVGTPLFGGQFPAIAPLRPWVPMLVVLVFVLLNSVPFLIAVRELLAPKDNTPLYIDMHYSKDPLFFGRKFRKLVDTNLAPLFVTPGMHSIDLSRQEYVEVSTATEIPPGLRFLHIFVGLKCLRTAAKVTFAKELYVRGRAEIGEGNEIKAVYAEDDLVLGKGVVLHRWGYSRRNIIVGGGANLGRNLASEGAMIIRPGCRFQSLYGLPICFSANGGDIGSLATRQVGEFGSHPVAASIQTEWVHSPGELFFNWIPLKSSPETGDGIEGYGDGSSWHFSQESAHLLAGSRVHCNIVSKRNLFIGEGCVMDASVKSYGAIHLRKGVVVKESLFAEGDIRIDENVQVWGNVFSQSRVTIGPGVKIGRPGSVKSVICKKGLVVDQDAVIFGYVLTEGEGMSS